MNIKRFVVLGITDFLLGWLLYAIISKSTFQSHGDENILFLFLGCMTFVFLVSSVFLKWTDISNATNRLQATVVMPTLVGKTNTFANGKLK